MEENPFASFSFQPPVTKQDSFVGSSSKFFSNGKGTNVDVKAHKNAKKHTPCSENIESCDGEVQYKLEQVQEINENSQEGATKTIHMEQSTELDDKSLPYDPLWHLSFSLPKGHNDPVIKEFVFVPPPKND